MAERLYFSHTRNRRHPHLQPQFLAWQKTMQPQAAAPGSWLQLGKQDLVATQIRIPKLVSMGLDGGQARSRGLGQVQELRPGATVWGCPTFCPARACGGKLSFSAMGIQLSPH